MDLNGNNAALVFPLLDAAVRTDPMAAPVASASSLGDAEGVLCSLACVVEQRDRHTAGHCERLAGSCVALGAAMGLDRASLRSLYMGGYLHDVGKVSIPDSILFKAGKLNGKQWEVMRSHPIRGEEICRPVKSLSGVLSIIRHHHERWDGTGYPDELRGTDIPLLARVLQVVDIYDALTTPRPYKHAYSAARALEILQEETDRGWRDKEIATLFIRRHPLTLAEIEPARSFSCGLMGISDSLRNLEALVMH